MPSGSAGSGVTPSAKVGQGSGAILNASSVGGATVEARIDGAVIGTVTGATIRSASRTADRINFGSITAATTTDLYWADLVCDNAGYPGNQYPGGSNGYPGDYPGDSGKKQKQPKQTCFLIFCAPK